MTREDRLKSIFKNAVPDHRLLPQRIRDAIEKAPRNQRRLQKKAIDAALKVAYANMIADGGSGAGYPIDQQLREYAIEYNDRQLGHGLMTLPASFNVMEGFFEYRANPPADFFALREEADHIFSLSDFLDFVTSNDPTGDPLAALRALKEGKIYNFTPIGDVKELAFLYAGSSRFVTAGFTMTRRDEQLHWMLIGGPICDLAEETKKLGEEVFDVRNKPPEKRHIAPHPDHQHRAEPLKGTDDVWKTVLFGRYNLDTLKHESRGVGRDHGTHYDITLDDPDSWGGKTFEELGIRERQTVEAMAEQLEKEALLFDIAGACFKLPAYFAYKVTLVRDVKRDTELASHTPRDRGKTLAALPARRPLFKTVAALEIINPSRPPVIRAYHPPVFQVEVEGFWRELDDPEAMGHDAAGKPIKGRTWVKSHLRWRERPRRPSTIFVKSSVAAAKAKVAAQAASDAAVQVTSLSLPLTLPVEVEEVGDNGWLYVMRCPLMDTDIYKVGWSSRPAAERAEELSSATGVPMSYIVVESWPVNEARRAEREAHLALQQYRVNPKREFFRASYEVIRASITPLLARFSATSEAPPAS